MGYLNPGSSNILVLLPGTSKAFTTSVFLPAGRTVRRVHVVLPATRRIMIILLNDVTLRGVTLPLFYTEHLEFRVHLLLLMRQVKR